MNGTPEDEDDVGDVIPFRTSSSEGRFTEGRSTEGRSSEERDPEGGSREGPAC
ncbi:hypothetical protein ACU635_22605 [[Actinomadura] parvosata]|uniref:hypothetical protein n=1 Tax=[Actinomadura] parvosata TaxID=1955412 RepID=UPI00406CC79A